MKKERKLPKAVNIRNSRNLPHVNQAMGLFQQIVKESGKSQAVVFARIMNYAYRNDTTIKSVLKGEQNEKK